MRAAMGDDHIIYLFKHDDGAMWKIGIQSLVEEYSSTENNRIRIKKLQNR